MNSEYHFFVLFFAVFQTQQVAKIAYNFFSNILLFSKIVMFLKKAKNVRIPVPLGPLNSNALHYFPGVMCLSNNGGRPEMTSRHLGHVNANLP